MNRFVRSLFFAVLAAAMAVPALDGFARSFRVNMVPNGAVLQCNTCHTSGGGSPRNSFGLAVQALVSPGGREEFWGPELAMMDSDGDGATNGEELQDPDGTWESGSPDPGDASLVTAPGDPNSVPAQEGGIGMPEDFGVAPRTDTIYVNTPPDEINNGNTESLGVAITSDGNIVIGWEDDANEDGLDYLGAIWTVYGPDGSPVTDPMEVTSTQIDGSVTTRFLSYFREDGSAAPANTAWGPKIKTNYFGEGFGMGATAYALGLEVEALADINLDAGGGGDFPAVQILNADGSPRMIVTGASDADAEPEGDIRISDWAFLSNGNIVVAGESRQQFDLQDRFGGAAGNHATYRVLDAEGNEVKGYDIISEAPEPNGMWHGAAVTENGFAMRFERGGRATVRLFDNSGAPLSEDIDIGLLTENEGAAGGGRGDGAGFAGNGVDAYAIANSADNDDFAGREVHISVLNADGTLRFNRIASDDLDFTDADRVDCAINAQGQVAVVWADQDLDGALPGFRLVLCRVFDTDGTPLSGSFYVSERETVETAIGQSRRPRVAWRNGTLAVLWESSSSEASGDRTVALRLFDFGETSVGDYSIY